MPSRYQPLHLFLFFYLLWIAVPIAVAQETVAVSEPGFVTFSVADVGSSSTGSPSSVQVTFNNASLNSGNRLRISVMADTADFTPPSSGGTIDSSFVSWTVTGSQGGSGSSGTLSSASFTQVFESLPDPSSGSVSLRFTLDPTGANIRAGDHTLSLRWQFESVP